MNYNRPVEEQTNMINGSPESTKKTTSSISLGGSSIGSTNKQPKSPTAPTSGMTPLAPNFVPGGKDVICARGKVAKDHPGNQWFRTLIEEHIEEYSTCDCKLEKSFVVSKVLKRVRKESPQGGFVKQIKGKYWEVGDRLSREKIGQTFRDILHTQYKSSTKSKATVRRQRAYAGDEGKSESEPESTTVATTTKQREAKNDQQSTRPTTEHEDASPRKKAKTTAKAEPETAKGVGKLPSLAMPPSEAVDVSNEQAFPLSSMSSLSSMMGPLGNSGYDVLQSFPSLPNLSRNLGSMGAMPTWRNDANYLDAVSFNPKVPHMERQHHQQQQQNQLLRQQQFAATRTTGVIGSTGDELDTVPFIEPLGSLAQRSTSFGESIDEMFQGQLFSSDNTLGSSTSESATNLPASHHPDN